MSRLIDADALKEWIDEYVSVFKKSDNKDIKGYIEHQPTIEPKRGEWIEREVLEDTVINEWQSARCSECGKYHTTPYMYYFDNFNFCPNCGAKMKGADDE